MTAVGHIHAASLASPRLRRVLDLLRDGQPRTTRQIVRQARVMAVNACISELRQLGAVITCTREADPITRAPRFTYTMLKAPPQK